MFEERMWKGARSLVFRMFSAFGHFLMKSSSPASDTGVRVRIGVRVEGSELKKKGYNVVQGTGKKVRSLGQG